MAVLAKPLLALKSITTDRVRIAKSLELLAARKASKLGFKKVSVTAIAAKAPAPGGRVQLVADPPCGAKLARLAATGKALPPIICALYGGVVPLRVSRMRQGTIGVYTRSSPVSPSDLACISPGFTSAVEVSALAITSRSPLSDPARLAARR